MKISYNWLKEFIDIKVNPQKLAEDLSLFGHEVESINKMGDDYILDFEITPNRGDLLSIYGMAREIAGLYNSKLKTPAGQRPLGRRQNAKLQFKTQNLDKNLKVQIADPSICSRFTARIIDNIKIGESPKWIKDRLISYGFRPLNNIVDITNYVMIETGQPLHSFDFSKLHVGSRGSNTPRRFTRIDINIRRAKKGESIITLDGKNRQLDENSIVMSNGQKIFDLAGIMGAYNSEVDKKTKTIILQASVFDPVLIRRTSKRLKHTTDASYRFERGVDPQTTAIALERASGIVKELCPQAVIGESIDKYTPYVAPKIKINSEKIRRLVGIKLSQENISKYLSRLNFICKDNLVTIPSYRIYDVKIWQDIAEEVARLYGYNKLGVSSIKTCKAKINSGFNLKESVKEMLVDTGFNEIYSYSFSNQQLLEKLGYKISNLRKVINGLSPETKYLRPSILPSLLTAFAKNPWAPEIKIFEIGKVFSVIPYHNLRESAFVEKWQLGIAATGKSDKSLKEVLLLLNMQTETKSIDQKVLDFLKIRRPVRYAILDITNDLLRKSILPRKPALKSAFARGRYRRISAYAPTIRDLAFIVKTNVNASTIINEIVKLDNHVLLCELFDEFASEKFGKNMKNIAYHIWLQDMNHPMDDHKVNKILDKIIEFINHKYQAKLRS